MVQSRILLQDISLCYRLAKQRIASFKEYAINWMKGSLVYEELWALQELSLTVMEGELLGIVGPNGAGKTTLLKVISGVLQPNSGEVQVKGRIAPILGLGMGFDFELTGLENLYLNAFLLGHTRKEIDARVAEIVDFSELGDFIRSPVRNYSTGMVARLGFAVATAWIPEVLILDEVLAVGDAAFQEKCHHRLQEYRRSGCTVLLVSHSPPAIKENCTRCIWLHKGRLQADGSPEEVVSAYVKAAHGGERLDGARASVP